MAFGHWDAPPVGGAPLTFTLEVMAIFLALVAFGIVCLNVLATHRVATSKSYDNEQKRAQYFLIWLVPLVGATLAYSFAREEKIRRVTTDFVEPNEQGDCDIRLDSASGNPFEDSGSHE